MKELSDPYCQTSTVPAPAQVKFYYLKNKKLITRKSYSQLIIGFYKNLEVIPNYKDGTLKKIEELKLFGINLPVYCFKIKKKNDEKLIASIDRDYQISKKEIAIQQKNFFDCEPIVLIDGQNFFKDIIEFKKNNYKNVSADKIINSVLKKFNKNPKKIILYICNECPSDYKQLLENTKKTINNLEIKYRETKFSYKIKTDIDPLLLIDLGIIIEKTKHNKECLVLFTGDSDYEEFCRQWLGEKSILFNEHCSLEHKLVIVSSFATNSFSSNLKDVCNHPNAQLLLIEDFINAPFINAPY